MIMLEAEKYRNSSIFRNLRSDYVIEKLQKKVEFLEKELTNFSDDPNNLSSQTQNNNLNQKLHQKVEMAMIRRNIQDHKDDINFVEENLFKIEYFTKKLEKHLDQIEKRLDTHSN